MLLLELQLLLELDVPNTEYGYWITGDGKLIPVTAEAHLRVAHQLLGGGKWVSDMYGMAAKAGWIRVIFRPHVQYQRFSADYVSPSTKARIALIQLIKMHREQLDDIIINVAKDPSRGSPLDRDAWDPHIFTGPKAGSEALRFLMQQ